MHRLKEIFDNSLLIVLTIYSGYYTAVVNGIAKKDILWEYCSGDYFSPQCNDDEVIIMERARYGHIQLSRCIDIDLGHFGCVSNKLSWLDQQCSGVSSCNIVIDKNIESQCPSAISRYLEAEYRCQQVFQLGVETCAESVKIPVTSRMQYISSGSSQGTNCGTDKKPWILEGKPGQKVNVSIVDFSWQEADESKISHPCPIRYGYVIDIDLNEAIDLCGGTSRQKHVHLSKGSSLQIIIEEDVLVEHHFIISYQAEGCPKFISPVDTWAKENNGIITVGCNDNSNSWKMRCIGNNWIGIAGSCEKGIVKDITRQEDSKNKHLLGMRPVVTLTIIGGVFLVIICVIVTFLIGIFCIKNSKDKRNGYYGNPISFDQHTLQMTNIYPSYRPVQNNPLDNSQTLQSVKRNDSVQLNTMNTTNGSVSPKYYILDRDDQHQPEAIYDVVYQNT